MDEEKQVIENQPSKSKKETYLEKMRERKPELNYEDEDAVWGAIADESDEREGKLKSLEEGERTILDAFNNNPATSGLFVEMVNNGKSALEYFIETYGDDFREALDDPEMADKLAQAQAKYTEQVAKNKAIKDEAEANLKQSLDDLDTAASEIGASDEAKNKAFEMFANIVDDAIREKVSTDTWKMFLKAVNYDNAVSEASNEGEVRGRNAQISEKLRKSPSQSEMPPQVGGQAGKPTSANATKFGGALDKLGDNYKEWYE